MTTNLADLIGPLPEQPKTPQAPTPWSFDRDYTRSIRNAAGEFVAAFDDDNVAALVVKLVNAAAAEQAQEAQCEVDHYVDHSGEKWWFVEGAWSLGGDLEDAARYAREDVGTWSNWNIEQVRKQYGPLKPVYK